MGLTSGKPTEHIRHGDPHVPDARTAATLAWLDGYDVLVVHGKKFSIILGSPQQSLVAWRTRSFEGDLAPRAFPPLAERR